MRRFLALAVKNDEENRHMDESNCVDSLPIALVAEAVGEAMFQEKIPNA